MSKLSKCQGLSGDVQLRHVETLVIGIINIYKPLSRKNQHSMLILVTNFHE